MGLGFESEMKLIGLRAKAYNVHCDLMSLPIYVVRASGEEV